MGHPFLRLLAIGSLVLAVPALAGPPPRGPERMPVDPDHARAAAGSHAARAEMAEIAPAGRGASLERVERPGTLAGTIRAIVLLVRFQDSPPGGPVQRFRATIWDSLVFGDTYVRGGADYTLDRTLRNYYRDVSYGGASLVTLDPPGTIGWLTLPHDYSFYCQADGTHNRGEGPFPRNSQGLVIDAVNAADPFVDFSRYAVDGVVRNLIVVHAGSGAEWNGGDTLIWSHVWNVDAGATEDRLHVDGVRVSDYMIVPEAGGNTTGEDGPVTGPLLPAAGVLAHEFGHLLGLPDEYDYGGESRGTGRMSLMANGCWNRWPDVYPDCAGNSPARPSAWAAARLGAVTPTQVTGARLGVVLPPVATTPAGSVLKAVYPGSDGSEYWLFENRQPIGFDEGLGRMGAGAHGLLIYHVDGKVIERSFWRPNEAACVADGVFAGATNCDCAGVAPAVNGERWSGIAVEQADGSYGLECGTDYGHPDDFWPGSTGATAFTPTSSPNSSSYYSYLDCTGLVAAVGIHEEGANVVIDSISAPAGLPATLALVRPRPNPMSDAVEIVFTLSRANRARVSVHDLAGREIAVLADDTYAWGDHSLTWDGWGRGGVAPPGLYFVRLAAEGRVATQRIVRLR